MAIGGSVMAHASSGTGKATAIVKAGSLTFSNATNQESLKLSKNMRLTSYTLPITVTDARGSGVGWNLMITSTMFSMTNSNGHLPANASSITGVSKACAAKSTCTLPTNSISYPLTMPAGTKPPSPVKFFNAALRSGLGVFSLVMMVNVTIPSDAESGTYTSTVYLTISNGP